MSTLNENKTSNKSTTIFKFLLIVFVASIAIFVAIFAILGKEYNKSPQNQAFGVNVATAVSSLEDAKAKLAAAQTEYQNAVNESNKLQAQINEASNKALEAQDEVFKNQQSLNKIAVFEYKEGSSLPYINVLLRSQNLDDLIKNIDHINKIMSTKAEAIAKEAKARDEFNSIVEDLNKKSDAYNASVNEANKKLQEIQAVVDSAKANLAAAEAEEVARQAGQGGGTPHPTPSPAPPSPQPDPSGWHSGMASAYGGSSDPGSGSRTATGERVDDFSMGVAIPMSWPNYRQYFGHNVQIKIGGTVVIARINDCGNLAGGARCLDLQPGVFKAFGYGSCQAWGVRRVEYKIL